MLKQLVSSIKKHPLFWFYIVSVLIQLAIIPLFLLTGAEAALSNAFEKTGIKFNTDLVTIFQVVLAAPSAFLGAILSIAQVAAVDIAVLIIAGIAYGKEGLIDLKKRFSFWQKGINAQDSFKIWASCIFVFCFMNLASAALNYLRLPHEKFSWNINFLSINFLIGLVVAMFLDAGGLFEENGWRGFALPLLQNRFHPLTSSIILGFFWSLWHVPVKYNLLFDYGFTGFVKYFIVFTLKLIFLSIIMTYFWNLLGQTTIIAVVMHGLSNDSVRLGGEVISDGLNTDLITEVNLIIPMAVVAIFIIWKTGGWLHAIRN